MHSLEITLEDGLRLERELPIGNWVEDFHWMWNKSAREWVLLEPLQHHGHSAESEPLKIKFEVNYFRGILI